MMVPPPARYPTPRPRARPTPPDAQFGTPSLRTGASAQDDEGSNSAPTLVRESDNDSQSLYSDNARHTSIHAGDDCPCKSSLPTTSRVRGSPLRTRALFRAARGARRPRHTTPLRHTCSSQCRRPHTAPPVPLAQRNVGGTFQRHGQRNQLRAITLRLKGAHINHLLIAMSAASQDAISPTCSTQVDGHHPSHLRQRTCIGSPFRTTRR